MATTKSKRPALLSISDVLANLPAGRGSVSTVHGWIASGRLPSVKVGRGRFVRRADLAAFLGIAPEDVIEASDVETATGPEAA